MENKDLKELKPIYIHEASYSSDHEISLIDLAMILVNRKKLVYLIFFSFLTLGIAAAVLAPKEYTFSTSLEIGSQIINGSVKTFETPQTLLAKLKYSYIPQVLNEQRQTDSESNNKYSIKVSIPESSDIIVLTVNSTNKQADLMGRLLQNITQKAVLDHNRIFESVKRDLHTRLEQMKIKLSDLGSGSDNRAEKASLQSNVEGLSSQLANLRNTREILPPMKSLEPSGISRKLIVIIATFSGLFIAVFAVFFVEFVAKVRAKQNEGIRH